ncbi:hypothetical protein Lesp02_34820 [Lentzea sp. NBRC 105346]|uniref:DUF2631 domain-containing protein n=1 Tax=Lentzea sp. NBRC 105346 TaxID=3032205 RepID=UPI0024A47F02|nr:DUF2631 domain-containing protein [Lentzea sp. NBRC 105346]GLZ31294.1 hypothetical protein Lesp02_34820 [Lentzea sp. NBRC 105346]
MSSSSELDKRPAVDPHEEPSHEWGWHGTFPKATRIAGWFTAIAMFAMLIGNHHGFTEDLWLIGTGIGLVAFLIWDQVRGRTSWRR